VSFAPLAARLAARAAEIRPAPGARNDWDKIGALIVCLVLEMLIDLCEALDARAAAGARPVAVAASRNRKAGSVQAPPGEKRAPRPALAPNVQAMIPSRADTLAGTTDRLAATGPWLVWSRDPGPVRAVLAPPWRPRRETRAFLPGSMHAHIVTKS